MSEISADIFESFRALNPACALLVLSDMRSGTVLLAQGDLICPQEYLDAVSAFAQDAMALAGPSAPYSVFHTPQCGRLIVRGNDGTDLALTAITAPDADFGPLLADLCDLAASLTLQVKAA